MLWWLLTGCGADPATLEVASVSLVKVKNASGLPLTEIVVPIEGTEEGCRKGTPLNKLPVGFAVVEAGHDTVKAGGEVFPLDKGEIDDSELRGHEFVRLGRVLDGWRRGQKALEVCDGPALATVAFAFDRDLPWSTVSRILYTAGQVGVKRFAFIVQDSSPDRPIPARPEGSLNLHVQVKGQNVRVRARGVSTEHRADDRKAFQAALREAKRLSPESTTAVIMPAGAVPWHRLIKTADAVTADGKGELFPSLYFAGASPPRVGIANPALPSPMKWQMGQSIPVFVSQLPDTNQPVPRAKTAIQHDAIAAHVPVAKATKAKAGKARKPSVDEVKVEPAALRAAAQGQLRRNAGMMQFCATQDDATGTMTLKLTVAKDGSVSKAVLDGSISPSADACVKARAESIRFAEGTKSVTWPLEF